MHLCSLIIFKSHLKYTTAVGSYINVHLMTYGPYSNLHCLYQPYAIHHQTPTASKLVYQSCLISGVLHVCSFFTNF